jgi:hypothetical protein
MRWLISDVAQMLFAALLYGAILVAPGAVIGRYTGVLSFRTCSPLRQLLLSISLSIGIAPILSHMVMRAGGHDAVLVVYGVVWLCLAWHIVHSRAQIRQWLRSLRDDSLLGTMSVAFGIWLVVAVCSLIDMPIGSLLYLGGPYYDHIAHSAVVHTLAESGVPPITPFFYPGESAPLVYYYLWYLVGAFVDVLGGTYVDARAASFAGTIWAGWALIAVTVTAIETFTVGTNTSGATLPRIGIMLLIAGGLDALIVLSNDLVVVITGHGFRWDHAEVWNLVGGVWMWVTATLWAPHHVASLVACIVGFLLLRDVDDVERYRRRVSVMVAGIAFASAAGMSVWVTLVAALIVAVWCVLLFMRHEWRELVSVISVGVVAVLVALPYLLELGSAEQFSGSPVAIGVRGFQPTIRVLALFGLVEGAWYTLANLISLPLLYAIEFGFVLFASVVWWRRRFAERSPLRRDELFVLVMLVVSLLAGSFLQSVMKWNDLGWRGIMLAQFALLITATAMSEPLINRVTARSDTTFAQSGRYGRTLLTIVLFVGFTSSGYELLKLRFHEPLEDVFHGGSLGREAAALRDACEWIDDNLASDAVIQFDPNDGHMSAYNSLYARRVMTYEDTHAGVYGIPIERYAPVKADLMWLWSAPIDSDDLKRIAHRYGIDYAVVTQGDSLWMDRGSWAWRVPTVYDNSHVRVIELSRDLTAETIERQGIP